MKRVTYVTYYSQYDDPQNRQRFPAAANKIECIFEALADLGYRVEILSACRSTENRVCPGRTDKLSASVTLRFFRSFPITNLFWKLLCYISIFSGLLLSLLRLHKDDVVIVYHSLNYMPIVRFAHGLRKFKLVLEVEEIYADVIGDSKIKDKELRFFQIADGYVFPSYLLDKTINGMHKPSLIIHGTYKAEKRIDTSVFAGQDAGTVHCVYAGTLDPRKGGAAAAAAALFLPKQYHIHIIGFGNEDEILHIKNKIAKINQSAQCTVSFDGLKQGKEYLSFLQSCAIGLSTQEPDSSFNATSFPSKILSYLGNGLRVVSIRIPAVETSDVSDLIFYYDEQVPEKIAEAIMRVDLTSEYDSRKRILTLSEKFRKELYNVVEELTSGKEE